MEERIEWIIRITATVALIIGCLMVLWPFLAAILSAAILCFSTWPVYALIERKLAGRRTLAALAMTLIVILILVFPLALVAAAYADQVPALVERVRVVLAEGFPMPPDWVASLPLAGDSLDSAWREFAGSREQLEGAVKSWLVPTRRALVATGIIIGEGVLQLALIAFVGFFFYRDGAALAQALRNGLNRVAGNLTGRLLHIVGGTINGVVYGIIGTGIAQAIAAAIGFLIAGVPGAPMLSFLTFFLSIVPAGPPVLWVSAAVWLFFEDRPGWAVFMAIWGFFVISGIDNVVKPVLISRGASLPFVLVLLGVLGGVLAFGFVGIFLGPTLLAVGFNLVRQWTDNAAAQAGPGEREP
jgi:predicted PurR-regulated permease PerM